MTLLLLGGTGEAKHMAGRLHQQGVNVIYSVAGLVRQPALPCQVISGGFSQRGGLQNYAECHGISAVLDMTHPYAEKMTATAAQVTEQLGLAYWRYQRPVWRASPEDHWHYATNYNNLWPALSAHKSVLWTSGQLPPSVLAVMAAERSVHHVVRTAVPPQPVSPAWPEHIEWLEAIGPFSLAQELALIERYKISALVSKDSGGKALANKLIAARQRQLPVYFLSRPQTPPSGRVFFELDICEQFISQYFLAAV